MPQTCVVSYQYYINLAGENSEPLRLERARIKRGWRAAGAEEYHRTSIGEETIIATGIPNMKKKPKPQMVPPAEGAKDVLFFF